MWTSIFMTLQIGIALSTLPLFFFFFFFFVADVGVNSGSRLCHVERTSRVLRPESSNFGLRIVYHSGSYLMAGLNPVCVQLSPALPRRLF
jgi:hypothetical protein